MKLSMKLLSEEMDRNLSFLEGLTNSQNTDKMFMRGNAVNKSLRLGFSDLT
jgi:hypothetical protein